MTQPTEHTAARREAFNEFVCELRRDDPKSFEHLNNMPDVRALCEYCFGRGWFAGAEYGSETITRTHIRNILKSAMGGRDGTVS